MSRRPNIQSSHEQKIERGIQHVRQVRDRAVKAASRAPKAGAEVPEPYITCVGRGPTGRPVPAAVRRWITAENREQLKHYRRISLEMIALNPLREKWVKAFYERITGPRGFSLHAGLRRTIAKSELPARPNRPWRVVW